MHVNKGSLRYDINYLSFTILIMISISGCSSRVEYFFYILLSPKSRTSGQFRMQLHFKFPLQNSQLLADHWFA